MTGAEQELRWRLDAVDEALGLPLNDDRSTARTLAAIRRLKSMTKKPTPLTDDEIVAMARDGMTNAHGGIYATSVLDFARAIEAAHGVGVANEAYL